MRIRPSRLLLAGAGRDACLTPLAPSFVYVRNDGCRPLWSGWCGDVERSTRERAR
jgi:hypothetical protein